MIYFKRHATPKGDIIAVCDGELLGKSYKEGNVELDLDKYSAFYKGEALEDRRIDEIPDSQDFYTANIVGTKSVNLFIKRGIVSRGEVKKVGGVPFVHVYKIL